MRENGNINIFNRIFNIFDKFYKGELNIDQLIGDLNGNITALDNVSTEFVDNFNCFAGEIDFIEYTESQDVRPSMMLKEVKDYEHYLKKYFEEYKKNQIIR